MALTQTQVTNYNAAKSSVVSNANTVVTSLATGDVLIWYNNKEKMYYAVKVSSKSVTNNVVNAQVYGVCFKFDSTVTTPPTVNDIFISSANGFIGNKKLDILNYSGYGDKIAYIKFFGRKTFSVNDLLFSTTTDFSDDIEQLNVIDASTVGGGYTATDAINGCEVYNVDPTTGSGEILAPGAARQLAFSCRHSIN